MFGIRFIKTPPNVYCIQYRKGNVVREGEGLSFFYYSPSTSLVAVPMASADVPFMLEEVTGDFQTVTVQGQITYRAGNPKQLARLLDFTLRPDCRDYASDDVKRLPQRVIQRVQVLVRSELQKRQLREALTENDEIVSRTRDGLSSDDVLQQLGIEVLGLAILAIKPTPETARALEADVREQMLKAADEATYTRRNAAVEQERAIKENELNTEIAVENKRRQIREAQVEAERAVQQKQQVMARERMTGQIALEQQNRDLVALSVENQKAEADAQAYGVTALMKGFETIDPRTMQALANTGMNPAQLIATAFQSLAENAGKIGNLNIAPELLTALMKSKGQRSA